MGIAKLRHSSETADLFRRRTDRNIEDRHIVGTTIVVLLNCNLGFRLHAGRKIGPCFLTHAVAMRFVECVCFGFCAPRNDLGPWSTRSHAHIRSHAHACMHTCTFAHMHTCTHTRTNARTLGHTHARTHYVQCGRHRSWEHVGNYEHHGHDGR